MAVGWAPRRAGARAVPRGLAGSCSHSRTKGGRWREKVATRIECECISQRRVTQSVGVAVATIEHRGGDIPAERSAKALIFQFRGTPFFGAHTAAETGRDMILVTGAVARSFFLISRSQRVSRYVAESVPIAP